MTKEDLSQIREVVQEVVQVELDKKLVPIYDRFDRIDGQLRSINYRLEVVETKIDGISQTLDEHTVILENHTRILEEHTQILDDHTELLNEHSFQLSHIETHMKIAEVPRTDDEEEGCPGDWLTLDKS